MADERTAVTGGWEGGLRTIDLESGRIVQTIADTGVRAFDVAVTTDGERLVIGGADGVRVFEIATGRSLAHLWQGHYLVGIGLLDNGRLAVAPDSAGTLSVWDLESGGCLHELPGAAGFGLALLPDGRHAVCGLLDGGLEIWDLRHGERARRLSPMRHAIAKLGASPDGSLLVVGCGNGEMFVVELESGKLRHELEPHAAWVRSIGVTSSGRVAISASEDRTLHAHDLETGRTLAHSGAALSLMSAVVTPNDRIVAAAGTGEVRFVDLLEH
jgi:WD40 repeat protein